MTDKGGKDKDATAMEVTMVTMVTINDKEGNDDKQAQKL